MCITLNTSAVLIKVVVCILPPQSEILKSETSQSLRNAISLLVSLKKYLERLLIKQAIISG
jgi:hypothetical protein